MQPLDYLHALCLLGVALYLRLREPPRLLLTPLMLIGFFVLYGVGTLIYFNGADSVQDVRDTVTICLILMWIGLVLGIELARAAMPTLAMHAERTVRSWASEPLLDRAPTNQLLAALGIIVALFILGMFFGLGKPAEILSFVALESTKEKQKFRLELGAQGGYLYLTLLACVAPFLSFLLLIKGAVTRERYLTGVGLLLAVAVMAGKVGTFQKIIWLVYLLQLVVAFLAAKRLTFGLGRILVLLAVLLGGAVGAALIAFPEMGADRLAEWLAYRFFEVNDEVVYQTFYVYPQHLPHTWGMNIGLIHNLFGNGELTSSYVQVANFFGAEGATFDAFFIADAWVDFSFAGVLLMAILVGFLVKSVDMYATGLGKTPIAVALIASGMYGLFELMVTSAFTAFLSGGLILIPLLVMMSDGLISDLNRGRRQWQR